MKTLYKSLFLIGILPLFSVVNADLPFNYGKASANYVDNTSGSTTGGVSNPYYVGGSIGSSEGTTYCDGATNCEDKDTSWKIFGGYKVLENVSGEIAYVNLGDVHKDGENSDMSAFTANAVGSFRVSEKFDVFGKVGGMRWSSENSDGDRDGFGITYGLGARMQMNENTKLRAEWEQLPGVETSASQDTDVNMLSIGVELSTY